MGYYVTLEESTFRLPAENELIALDRLKALNHKPGVTKNGMASTGGTVVSRYFSWMPEDYDKTVESTADVFKLLGFDVTEGEDGLTLDNYDNKTGQEQLFIEEIADLLDPETYMIWRGEDGSYWKWSVEKGHQDGRIEFD